MPTTDRKGRTELLPKEALAGAGLLIILGTQMGSDGVSGGGSEAGSGLAGAVLVGLSVVWLVLLGAAVLILRSYCFRALWDSRPVEPGSYLKGMYQVWGVLVVGALLAVLGTLLMGSMLPGGLVALGAVVLLVFAKPDGRALGV